MKTNKIRFSINGIISILIFAILFSCNTKSEKVEMAKENLEMANEDLERAKDEFQAEMDQFRQEINTKIATNDSTIKVLQDREIKRNNAKLKLEIAKLKETNAKLKMKMADAKMSTKEKWDEFKREFSHDMDGLGKALDDLVTNNKK